MIWRSKHSKANACFALSSGFLHLIEKLTFTAAYISTGALDQLILSVCRDPKVTPMDYLVSCWRRASVILRTTPPSRLDEHKANILITAKRLCINYGEYCITMPDVFE